MIVDAHVHLPPAEDDRDFSDSKRLLLEEMEKKGVDYALVIPDNVSSPIGDLDECLGLTEDEGKLFLLGSINIFKEGKEWIRRLDSLMEEGKIRGVKIYPGHDPIYPTDKRLNPVYESCIKNDLPVVIHTGPDSDWENEKYNDPKHIVKVAESFPDLKIVLSHYFFPEIEYCYRKTRGYENIYFDSSALADEEVLQGTSKDKIKNILEKTVEDDPESVIFGSDYSMCDFKEHIDLINSLDISKKQRERIFWKNAQDLFRLDI